ncbi:transglutaminase-like cysteine peptidase [Tsuneonella sp. YG55]|uniref:Transglutaminase-like cysteine peptidase n=1 Tax=Tsuneonella litorea TaxID=2976475 RepID=A0A9X2W423_9SPHN|nr:transglutaminase-like cysteine peptidase [Tsuneonella litorea]MCT2559286.1 transglutaminase-like cysteine peptidase [Tsuneonella litorea]
MASRTNWTIAIAALAAAPPAVAQIASDPLAATRPSADASVAADCAAPPVPFVMPTTGAVFTLPPDPVAAEGCAPSLPPPPQRPPAPSLFDMVAMPIGTSAPARKWDAVRLGSLAGQAGPWDELVAEVMRLPAADPVRMVNRWVNWHVRYRDDPAGDEWAPAAVTLRRGFGDCEDYALAKMALLQALGVPSDDMYLVLLRDGRQAQHAVLAVNRQGRLFVLDDRTDRVLPAEAIADYTPILSFSGSFAWTYGARGG